MRNTIENGPPEYRYKLNHCDKNGSEITRSLFCLLCTTFFPCPAEFVWFSHEHFNGMMPLSRETSGTCRAILRRNLEKARLVAPGGSWLTNQVPPGASVLQDWKWMTNTTMDGMDGMWTFHLHTNWYFQALPACVTFIICEWKLVLPNGLLGLIHFRAKCLMFL